MCIPIIAFLRLSYVHTVHVSYIAVYVFSNTIKTSWALASYYRLSLFISGYYYLLYYYYYCCIFSFSNLFKFSQLQNTSIQGVLSFQFHTFVWLHLCLMTRGLFFRNSYIFFLHAQFSVHLYYRFCFFLYLGRKYIFRLCRIMLKFSS